MINKEVSNADEAIHDIADNATLMLGGLVFAVFLKTVLRHW